MKNWHNGQVELSGDRIAWLDESIHIANPGIHDGWYILAATITATTHQNLIREKLRGLLAKKQPRLHWQSENPKQRLRITETIAQFPIENIVVVGNPVDEKRQERARRKCMERLLFELDNQQLTQVYSERRHSRLNQRDLKLVDAARSSKVISNRLRLDFVDPNIEPMVWLPDIVAGIVGTALVRADNTFLDYLGDSVTEIRVPVA